MISGVLVQADTHGTRTLRSGLLLACTCLRRQLQDRHRASRCTRISSSLNGRLPVSAQKTANRNYRTPVPARCLK